jgi:hypothetical protein
MADLPNMVDAIFAGNHDDPGWVEMSANDKKGCACVDALFPEAHIAWREPADGAPSDWQGFEANPDVLALLLAMGVMRQGGRAAYFREGQIEIVLPHSGY